MKAAVISAAVALVLLAVVLFPDGLHASPVSTPPHVVTVKIPNGKPVVCLDFGEWGTCDLLGFTSGTH